MAVPTAELQSEKFVKWELDGMVQNSSKDGSGLFVDPIYLSALASLDANGAQSAPNESPMSDVSVGKASATKVRLAVLPFVEIGQSNDDYFAEGVAEDILTELSRFRQFLVISRNSSFSFRGKPAEQSEVARILGADYLVTGNIRRAGTRIRITAQLSHAPTREEVWSEKYDRQLDDLFALQDDIVKTIVMTLVSRLNLSEAERLQSRTLPKLEAYECLLLARKFIGEHDAERAFPYVEQALRLDPSYAAAFFCLAGVHYVRWLGNMKDENLNLMEVAARKAVELDASDARNLAVMGIALCSKMQLESAGAYLKRAMELNPYDSHAMPYYAEWLWRVGNGQMALVVMDDLLQRDPIPLSWYWEVRGQILTLLRRYPEALDAFSRQTKQFWYVRGYKAICYAYLSRLDAAKLELHEMLRENPDQQGARTRIVNDTENLEYRGLLDEGLTLAGLPQ